MKKAKFKERQSLNSIIDDQFDISGQFIANRAEFRHDCRLIANPAKFLILKIFILLDLLNKKLNLLT